MIQTILTIVRWASALAAVLEMLGFSLTHDINWPGRLRDALGWVRKGGFPPAAAAPPQDLRPGGGAGGSS